MSSSDRQLDDKIQEGADTARHLHDTFRKFVPKQFIDHLTGGNVGQLALGHADEDEVAVMFLDIRGFTGLCEELKPQQVLNFLNAFFTRMNAPIQLHHGFIDKFIGDAILALFDRPDGDAEQRKRDAFNAAQDIMKALALYNSHRANSGYQLVEIGIGIHFGPVIIGTVGCHDRMDTTVLGDTVNVAQRLERLTREHDANVLVTETMLSAIPEDTASSMIGEVALRGKRKRSKIYKIG